MRRFRFPQFFCCLPLLILLAPGCTTDEGGVSVATEYGKVRGIEAEGYIEFLGIPYAAPPVGNLRWRAPQPHEGWSGVLDTTLRTIACPQILPRVNVKLGEEDCLFMNVHTPSPMPESAPVLVWIHGGGFTLGEGLQVDDGSSGDLLVQGSEEVVVVSFNYRLGALGFLSHPALSAESANGVSGNYGFLDQIAALKWVRDNIAAFGGDPERITIAGESAGGMSVCHHLNSSMSSGLFDRAIIQSGPCQDTFDMMTGEAQGSRFAAEPAIDCDGAGDAAAVLACMRALSPDVILKGLPGAENFVDVTEDNGLWFPTFDGYVFDVPISMALANGPTNPVPLLVGFNADEGSVFLTLGGDTTPPTPLEYTALLEGLVSPASTVEAAAIVAHYPYDPTPGVNNLVNFANAQGDQLLTCASRRTSMSLAAYMDSYVYYFTYPDAGFQLAPGDGIDLGAFHSAELQYVFGHPSKLGVRSFEGDDITLHHAIRDYWLRFIATGDPNGGGAPNWPEYDPDPASDTHLIFDRTITTGMNAQKDDCDLWESIPDSAWNP